MDYSLTAKDSATARTVCLLHGKNLHRFEAFHLKHPDGQVAGIPEVIFEAKDSLVLSLPEGTPPGTYVIHLERKDDDFPVPVVVDDAIRPSGLTHLATKAEVSAALQQLEQPDLSGFALRSELEPLALKTDLDPFALKALKGVRCAVTAGASMPATAGWTAIPFDGTTFDTDGCRYGSQEKAYCETAGYYLVTAKVIVPTSTYYAELRVNGQKVAGDSAYSSVGGASMTLTAVVALEEDDYLECFVRANSGGAFTVQAGSEMSMVKVGE